MSLHYPENSGIIGYNDEGWKEYVKEQLDLRIDRFKNKQHKINELTYEKELIENDIIDIIKTTVHSSKCGLFWGMRDSIFTDTWRYFWHKDDNEWSEEDKTKFKTSYEYVIRTLKEEFFKDYDVELVEVIEFWYGVSYEFTYKYKNQTIRIEVPCYSMANKENYAYLLNGYRALYPENERSWSTIAYGIDYRDIIEKLHQWINENCK